MILKHPKAPRFNIPDNPKDMEYSKLVKFNEYIEKVLDYLANKDGAVSSYDRACRNYEPYIVELRERDKES